MKNIIVVIFAILFVISFSLAAVAANDVMIQIQSAKLRTNIQ